MDDDAASAEVTESAKASTLSPVKKQRPVAAKAAKPVVMAGMFGGGGGGGGGGGAKKAAAVEEVTPTPSAKVAEATKPKPVRLNPFAK
jgi:hypothetical protein